MPVLGSLKTVGIMVRHEQTGTKTMTVRSLEKEAKPRVLGVGFNAVGARMVIPAERPE
jgi:hypothetical protein